MTRALSATEVGSRTAPEAMEQPQAGVGPQLDAYCPFAMLPG